MAKNNSNKTSLKKRVAMGIASAIVLLGMSATMVACKSGGTTLNVSAETNGKKIEQVTDKDPTTQTGTETETETETETKKYTEQEYKVMFNEELPKLLEASYKAQNPAYPISDITNVHANFKDGKVYFNAKWKRTGDDKNFYIVELGKALTGAQSYQEAYTNLTLVSKSGIKFNYKSSMSNEIDSTLENQLTDKLCEGVGIDASKATILNTLGFASENGKACTYMYAISDGSLKVVRGFGSAIGNQKETTEEVLREGINTQLIESTEFITSPSGMEQSK